MTGAGKARGAPPADRRLNRETELDRAAQLLERDGVPGAKGPPVGRVLSDEHRPSSVDREMNGVH